MNRLLLITNAAAGTADERAIGEALEVLREGAEVEVVATRDEDELLTVLADRPGLPVVVAGGDGSLHALVAALDELGRLRRADGDRGGDDAPVVGLVPLGTGNDFSRALDLPRDPGEAAAVVLGGRTEPIDVVRDETGGLVVNVAHVGVGAEAGERAGPWKARFSRVGLGVVGYAVGAVLALFTTDGWRLTVVADGRRLTGGGRRVLQVAVANGRTIGGGARIAPDSDVSDGLIDVAVSFATGRVARIRYGLAMRRGRHHALDDVVRTRAREVTVRAQRGTFTVNTDGELSHALRSRTWRLEPAAYRMLVPGDRLLLGDALRPGEARSTE
ncbi:MAG: diacylglycerol kinase family protein [Dermatophilaceae bacterium]